MERRVTEELSSKELEDWRGFCIELFRTKNSFKQLKVKLKILKHKEMDDKTRTMQGGWRGAKSYDCEKA
jgi:hypothetical protein